MNHLESLVGEYLEWQGYFIRRNAKVGKLSHGGWAMEIDVVGYNPHSNHLVHYEPSLDAYTWDVREKRFHSKFEKGRQFIIGELFSWLPPDLDMEQIAICPTHPKGRDFVGGGRLISVDEFLAEVREAVRKSGPLRSNAISENFPLLRTLQLAFCGYSRPL